VAWNLVGINRASIPYLKNLPAGTTNEEQAHHRAALAFDEGHLSQALAEWRSHTWPPVNSGELTMLAESLADAGSEAAAPYAEQLRRWEPADADFVIGRLRLRQNRLSEAATALQRGLLTMRHDPWETSDTMGRALDDARHLSTQRAFSPMFIDAFSKPFAAGQWEDVRRWYLAVMLRDYESCTPRTVRAIQANEPWPPWQKEFLTMRRDCYATLLLEDLKRRANRDLESFAVGERTPLVR
jgi:hypothetical protein